SSAAARARREDSALSGTAGGRSGDGPARPPWGFALGYTHRGPIVPPTEALMTPFLSRCFVPFALALPLAAQKPTPAYFGLEVRAHSPASQAHAPVNTPISFTFDHPLRRSTIDSASFRVFGRESGPMQGTFAFSNLDRTVTFVPARAFAPGELVSVNL